MNNFATLSDFKRASLTGNLDQFLNRHIPEETFEPYSKKSAETREEID